MRRLTALAIVFGVAACAAPPVENTLEIVSEPMGAEVFVNDTYLGRTPTQYSTVYLPGRADQPTEVSVRVALDQFQEETRRVAIDEPVTQPLQFDLSPLPSEEFVIVSTDPEGAGVSRDGEYLCDTPCEVALSDLDPSERRLLRLERRGYQPELILLRYRGTDFREDNLVDNVRKILRPEPADTASGQPSRGLELQITEF